ncbi:MAG: DMT family transporter [Candidatus Cloacimonetes bacterium]|nr:DMT family transporter [Candidatus Cloacimonadota bacterium]
MENKKNKNIINQNKAYIFAAIAVLFWSTASTSFKITLRYLNTIETLFYASLTASIALFVIILFQRKIKSLFKSGRNEILNSAILGFMNPFFYYIILFKAYTLLPAQIAQPLNFIWPIMIVILSIPLLKQKISLKSLLAIFISFFGVLLISTKGRLFNLRIDEPYGVFLALSSSIIWALFFIINVRNRRDEVISLFLSFTFGSIYSFILLYPNLSLPPLSGILGAIYIGLFEMGITFVIWIKALKYSRTTAQVNNLIYLTPFLSLIVIRAVIKERILLSSIVGVIFIVSGIILQNRIGSKHDSNN